MSASREKRARKGTQEEILQQKLTEAAQQKAKTKKNVLIGIAVALVVVLLIGSIVLFNGPFFLHNSVAVTTGSHELSPVETRYFYYDAYQQVLNQGYGSMMSLMYGENVEISEMVYDEATGQTWSEVVMNMALENINATYAFYDKAVAEGYTLSEEGAQAIANSMQTVELYAQMYGVTTDDYLRGIYGKGANLETFEAYQNVLALVSEYQVAVSESYTYDEATLQAAYEADPTVYDVYTYRSYLISAETKDENGTPLEGDALTAAMDEAKVQAEEMAAAAADNEEAFLAACAEKSGNEAHLKGELTLRNSVRQDSMSLSIRDWVTDPAREAGDTAAIEYEATGYYVVYFIDAEDNDYDALNIRSIYISAETTDADGNTTTDWDAAQARVDTMKAEIDASADLLADMDDIVLAHSDDENTAYSGGVYEIVNKSTFESAVNDWLFAEGRAIGDSEVIQGEAGFYYIYVESNAGNYRDYLVRQDLMLEDYNVMFNEVTAATTASAVESGMKYVERSLLTPVASSGY